MGQRVQRAVGGTTYDYVFDNEGHENTKSYGGFTTTNWSNLYFGGTRVSAYANGTTYFSHNDYLGTPRTQTDPTGNTDGSAYTNGPWGEGGSNALPGDLGFTGDLFDNPDGEVFHTPNRKYSPMQGRWMIPDPAGVAAVDVANPQSWNRYAYVLNNPVSATDPLGLFCVWDDGSFDSNDDPQTGNSGDCQNDGGTWFNGSPDMWADIEGNQLFGSSDWSNASDWAAATDASIINPDGTDIYNSTPSTALDVTGTPQGTVQTFSVGYSVSGIFPLFYGLGLAFTFSRIPSLNLTCMGGGAGASAGHNLSAGPTVVSTTGAKDILSGWSVSAGYNSSFLTGGGGSLNGSGSGAGNTLGIPGLSASLTWSKCW
jgi:RHS repeat-associated protein